MAVPSSTEVVPTKSKTKGQITRNGNTLEPCTTGQTNESLQQDPVPMSTDSESGPVSVPGLAPRRSFRLASKASKSGATEGSFDDGGGRQRGSRQEEDEEEIDRVSDGGIEEMIMDSGSEESKLFLGSGSGSGEAKGKRKLEDCGDKYFWTWNNVGKRGTYSYRREDEVQELGNLGKDDKGKAVLDLEGESAELDSAETVLEKSKGRRKIGSSSEEEELIVDDNGNNRIEQDGSESEADSSSSDNEMSYLERLRARNWTEYVRERNRLERRAIADRFVQDKLKAGSASSVERKPRPKKVEWSPKNGHDRERLKNAAPSLQELSLRCLADNADKLVSLDYVPDHLRRRWSQLLCDSRRMNVRCLKLLAEGTPREICLRDCSLLTEKEFRESFQSFDPSKLMVLQLCLSGPCLPDYSVCTTLARSANCLPALTTLSIRGACRLSDIGFNSLVCSAPALTSLDLTECSLLTSFSIDTLANSLGSILRELYLDHCLSINPVLMLPALKKLERLEVLSLGGFEDVCDEFMEEFIRIRGHNMKELTLADCINLTDSSLKIIAEKCPRLRAIDLSNLCKLTDSSLKYLSNCPAIQSLKLRRNPFSDKPIAAFLETSGEHLKELLLNNVKMVGGYTALSIARRSRMLRSLDLSFCRDVTDKALGLIVDSCLSLKVLKLFGCTQITDVFLNGHSNPGVKIIGLPMHTVLEDFEEPIV